jgi:hypothetical protein
VYPNSLAELVPEFLDQVPEPTWGLQVWIYGREPSGFSLQVHESSRTGDGNAHWFAYLGQVQGWQMGD